MPELPEEILGMLGGQKFLNNLEVIVEILQTHHFRSLYLPTDNEENTIYPRISKRCKLRDLQTQKKLRATKFGDYDNSSHKILSEEGESRLQHRYAVVVQDLATQWLLSYPCQKTSHKTVKSLRCALSRKKTQRWYIQTSF